MNAQPFTLESQVVTDLREPPPQPRRAPKPAKSAVPRRPMTADETQAVECLKRVTTPPACWDKRFIRDVGYGDQITEKEAAQVWRLFHKYRRQISGPCKDRLLELARSLAAPDLRHQAKEAEERRRIAATRANNE